MRIFTLISAAGVFMALPATVAAAELDVAGTWLTEAGNAKIAVADCGDGTPCGTLAWFESEQGMTETDINNTDPDKQSRTLLGSEVFWGFKAKKTKWTGGKIYDAESGKTYKSKLELADDGTLKVKGCVGPICQTQIWTRVE